MYTDSRYHVPEVIETEPGAILVEILPGDEIRINGRSVDFRAVRANLEQLHAVNPEHPLLVQAAAASTTQALVSVLDAAELAEIASVSVGPL
jgi:biopolymer transport protein ExbD